MHRLNDLFGATQIHVAEKLSLIALENPGKFFYAEKHFRIGITRDTKILGNGLERVGAALDELRN